MIETPLIEESMPYTDGEPIIVSPYYTPSSEVIEPTAAPETTAEPTLAPESMPLNQGSSSRVFRDSSVLPVSYETPVTQSTRTSNPPRRIPIVKASQVSAQPTRRSTTRINPPTASTPLRVSAKPKRDNPPVNATRLKAVPQNSGQTSGPKATNSGTTKQSSPRGSTPPSNRRPSAMNWEKFGLSNPERSNQTTAAIKQTK